MRKTFLTGMMFLVVLLGVAGTTGALEVAGIVVDETGKPVSGVRLVVVNTDPVCRESQTRFGIERQKTASTSAADGTFSLCVGPGDLWGYMIVAVHPDYSISVLDDILLKRIKNSRLPVQMVMGKRGFIQGRVVNSEGKPVYNATVTSLLEIIDPKQRLSMRQFLDASILSAKTDEQGVFKLEGLPESATALIRVTHPDYCFGVVGATGDPRTTLTGPIPAGTSNVVITLQPGSTVEGRVLWEESAQPAVQAKVWAVPEKKDFYTQINSITTDDQGSFSIKGLVPGKYTLQNMGQQEGVIVPRTIEVAPSAKLTGQDLTMTKGIIVSGKCVNADTKDPIDHGFMVLCPKNNPHQDMSYEILPDGTFNGRMLPGEMSIRPFVSNQFLASNPGKDLSMIFDKDRTDLVFELTPLVYFRGRVIDSDGKPISGTTIAIRNSITSNQAVSDTEGYFQIQTDHSSPDHRSTIFLDVSHPDRPDLRGMYGRRYVGEDDLKGDIVVKPVGTLRGKVLDAQGKSVPSTRITTSIRGEKGGASDKSAICDATGQFEINDLVGDAVYSISVETDTQGKISVEKWIESGKICDIGTLMLPVTDMTIEGTVWDEAGIPIAGVQLSSSGDDTVWRNTCSDDKGHFRFDRVANESLQINARCYGPGGIVYAYTTATAGDKDVEVLFGKQSKETAIPYLLHAILDKEAPILDVATWIAGKVITLESLRGVPVVLAFIKSEDSASEDLIAVLDRVGEKFPKIPVLVICSSDTATAAIKKNTGIHNEKLQVAVDKDGATAKKYGVRGSAICLIDAEGKVQYYDLGFPAVESALESMNNIR